MKNLIIFAACIVGLISQLCNATGVSIPFSDGFESYTNAALTSNDVATGYWSLDGANAQAIVNNDFCAEGIKGCSLTNANLTLNIDGAYTNIWCRMFINSGGYNDKNGSPVTVNNASVGFYVATNGYLRTYVFNGSINCWTNAAFVSTSCWVGVAVHLDYSNHTWDLYYTTNSHDSSMIRANEIAYRMPTNAANSISSVIVQNNGMLDEVSVSQGSGSITNLIASPSKMISMEIAGCKTNLMGILAHHYSSSDDTLAGALGQDLRGGFSQGDRIGVYCTNGWNIYVLAGGAWNNEIGSLSPENMHITSGMGLKTMRSNPMTATIFYPYSTVSNISATIYGTNYGGGGWNLLAWPLLTSQSASVSGWGFTSWAGHGDTIYPYNNGYYSVSLWYDHVANRWMDGRYASSYIMTKGQAFWLYHKTTGSNTWVYP